MVQDSTAIAIFLDEMDTGADVIGFAAIGNARAQNQSEITYKPKLMSGKENYYKIIFMDF